MVRCRSEAEALNKRCGLKERQTGRYIKVMIECIFRDGNALYFLRSK